MRLLLEENNKLSAETKLIIKDLINWQKEEKTSWIDLDYIYDVLDIKGIIEDKQAVEDYYNLLQRELTEEAYELKYSEEELKKLRKKTPSRRKNQAPNASEKNIASNLYSKQSYQNYGHDGSQAMGTSNSSQIGSGTSALSSTGAGGTSSGGSGE